MILYIKYFDFGEYCPSSYILPDRHMSGLIKQSSLEMNTLQKAAKKLK